jgi:hypothetical protein
VRLWPSKDKRKEPPSARQLEEKVRRAEARLRSLESTARLLELERSRSRAAG